MIDFIVVVIFSVQMQNDALDAIRGDYEIDDDLEQDIRYSNILTYAVTAILTALWIYPSVFLVWEIQRGIMTRETYPREEKCCCCTKNPRAS